jgi:hypothetical protein
MHRRKSRPWLTKTTLFANKTRRSFDQQVRPAILDASGLALLTVSAFAIDTVAGFAVAGLACFVFQWRLRG